MSQSTELCWKKSDGSKMLELKHHFHIIFIPLLSSKSKFVRNLALSMVFLEDYFIF